MPPDERLKLLEPALALKTRAALADTDPWLYAVLTRLSEPVGGHVVGGHGIASLAPRGKPGDTVGFDFRTPFAWDSQYDGFYFELLGLVADLTAPRAACPPEMLYPLTMEPGPNLNGPEDVVLILRTARVMRQGVPVFGRGEWEPGWTKVEYSHVGVTPGTRGDARVAAEGLRLFAGIPHKKPGPTPGTVKAQRYKSAELWRAAIREKVLSKTTRLVADDGTIAHWLGISPTTLYDLLKRWGPPRTLEELRNGKF